MNDATVRRKFDTVYQNVLRRKNPNEILFKDISKLDSQNPIIGSLLSEIESVKFKDSEIKKFLRKAPDIKDVETKKKLDKLNCFNDARQFNNSDSDNGDNNDNVESGIPSSFPPRPPPLQPSPFIPNLMNSFYLNKNHSHLQLELHLEK